MTTAPDTQTLSPPAPTPPSLSVVIVTLAGYEEIALTVRHLRAQTMAREIELLIATPEPSRVLIPPGDVAALHSIRKIEVPPGLSLAASRALSVPHATGPVVAFAEDHSFPSPGWAAALLEGHALGYAGVAPRMSNANPGTGLSWAAMFLHFGGAVEPEEGFETDYPAASHNMSYLRDALLEVGEDLGRRMLAELFLHEELRRRGHRMRVHPAAETRHVNISRWRPALRHAWIGGRLYGGLRASFGRWSLARRVLYAGGAPLIPPLRLSRLIPLMRGTPSGRRVLWRALPAVVVILVVHATGEAAGYLLGVGNTEPLYSDIETARYRFVRGADRSVWE